MYYVLTKNQELCGIVLNNAYEMNIPEVTIHEMDGLIPDLNIHVWDANLESFKMRNDGKILTKLQFLSKFSLSERISITSSTDPIIIDIMKMFEAADYINMTDEKTIQALQYFLHSNMISQTRYLEIIS